MQGEKRQKLLTVADVLFYTGEGKQVYERYCNQKLGTRMRCPWRRDRQPSFAVEYLRSTWRWKDFGTEEGGNAIGFVQKMFGLSFKDAIEKIKWDFNLGGKESIVVEQSYNNSEPETKKLPHISYIPIPFQKRHHEFWNAAEATEDWCKKFNCFAVKSASLNYQRVGISSIERVFAYHAIEEDKVKLYFPDRKGRGRFLNSASYRYLWNYNNLSCCDNLIIQKSPKDMIITSLIHPHVIATQAEHIKIFDEDTVKKITNISKEVFISYGSDDDGKKKSIAISKEFGWKWVNPQNKFLTEGINDFYSLVCKYGLKEMEKLLKYKKII